jgi:hypothetical protein
MNSKGKYDVQKQKMCSLNKFEPTPLKIEKRQKPNIKNTN